MTRGPVLLSGDESSASRPVGALSSGAALISPDTIGEPEDIDREHYQGYAADDQAPSRQVDDERNQRPKGQRNNEPPKEKCP